MSWIPHSFCEALHDVTTWEWHRVRLQSNSVVTISLLDKHHFQHLCPWCQTANCSFILLGRPKDGRVCSQLSVCFLRSLILYFYLLSVAGFRESIFFKLTRRAFSLLPNWWNGFQEKREGGYFGFESFHYIFFSLVHILCTWQAKWLDSAESVLRSQSLFCSIYKGKYNPAVGKT